LCKQTFAAAFVYCEKLYNYKQSTVQQFTMCLYCLFAIASAIHIQMILSQWCRGESEPHKALICPKFGQNFWKIG